MSAGRARSVVLISLDTLRYDCVGACPDRRHLSRWGVEAGLATPNLDAFLGECLYFTQARTTAPYTTAAHASVMTGLYPNRHGVRAFYKWGLAEGVGTLASELRARGYTTVAVQESGEHTALRTGSRILEGFDAFFAEERAACARCAQADGPVLLFIHTFDIHAPYCKSALDPQEGGPAWHEAIEEALRRLGRRPPEAVLKGDRTHLQGWVAQEARRTLSDDDAVRLMLDWYLRGVRRFDAERWPRIVAALRSAGLYDGALIIVFADHGEAALPDTSGAPMSHADSLLEDAIRVPLAVRLPGARGERVDRAVSLVDVAPTVTDWLGVEPAVLGRAVETDGRSLLALEGEPDRTTLAEAWQTMSAQADQAGHGALSPLVGAAARPYQACAVRGGRKVIWQPGWPVLRRFTSRAGSARSRLKGLIKRVAPKAALRLMRRLRMRTAAGPGDALGWRTAPVFALDLAADPLEEHPRRVAEESLDAAGRELLACIRDYWQAGVCGPEIRLERAEDKQVMEHLKGLGYAD